MDGPELAGGTDPLDKDEYPVGDGVTTKGLVSDTTDDNDGDGLTDAEEGQREPTAKADSDGDGV